jgi:uncharacterized membrane protein
MNKYEFLYKLNESLDHCSAKERKEVVHYYDELIQDAIDNGESEALFIDKLGSIDKITRTIKKDTGFLANIKDKKNFELKKVFDVSVKILGYFIFAIVVFTIGTIAFSFVTSGGAVLVYSVIRLYEGYINSLSTASLILYGGNIAVGMGLILVGVWAFKWLFNQSKNQLEKILEYIQSLVKKEGE